MRRSEDEGAPERLGDIRYSKNDPILEVESPLIAKTPKYQIAPPKYQTSKTILLEHAPPRRSFYKEEQFAPKSPGPGPRRSQAEYKTYCTSPSTEKRDKTTRFPTTPAAKNRKNIVTGADKELPRGPYIEAPTAYGGGHKRGRLVYF